MALAALCYNWGFFTILGYAPFPMQLSPIKLGLVFCGWGILVAIFAVFGAPWLQARLGIARTMYLNLSVFALMSLGIAIWTLNKPVLIVLVITSGIVCGVNNTVTTQAVMTVSPVERPVASAAYSFVRFIGGGLAPYVGRGLVVDLNIHVPFYLGAGVIVLGILILSSGHKLLGQAERVQAEQVTQAGPGGGAPAVGADPGRGRCGGRRRRRRPHVVLAAVDDSPIGRAGHRRRGPAGGRRDAAVHVVHAQEGAIAGDAGHRRRGRSPRPGRVVSPATGPAGRPAASPPSGHVLLHAADHGAAGRLVAEYADSIGAATIVLGAPSHGGLPALMDASASRELLAACPQPHPGHQPRGGRPLQPGVPSGGAGGGHSGRLVAERGRGRLALGCGAARGPPL